MLHNLPGPAAMANKVMKMIVSKLFIYPIKSLGGISVTEAEMDGRGLRYDRRYMLITPDGQAMTQHKHPQMALVEVSIDKQGEKGNCLNVWHRHRPDAMLTIPMDGPTTCEGASIPVTIWEDRGVLAIPVSEEADQWFSSALNEACQLVFMPPTTHRPVDPAYAQHGECIGFTDGYPYLIIGQASLDDLNQRLAHPIEMRQFRPNIVVNGSEPYAENDWTELWIGDQTFYPGAPCGRCMLVNLNPQTGQHSHEPLKTLATYRHQNGMVVFGQYVLAKPPIKEKWDSVAGELLGEGGIIQVGQTVTAVVKSEIFSDYLDHLDHKEM